MVYRQIARGTAVARSYFARHFSTDSLNVTVKDIQILRLRSQFPIAQCKQALQLHGTIEKALAYLNDMAAQQGLTPEAVTSRTAKESLRQSIGQEKGAGILTLCMGSLCRDVVVVEAHCQTEFAGGSDYFRSSIGQFIVPWYSHLLSMSQSSSHTIENVLPFMTKSTERNPMESPSSPPITLQHWMGTCQAILREKVLVDKAIQLRSGDRPIFFFEYCHPPISPETVQGIKSTLPSLDSVLINQGRTIGIVGLELPGLAALEISRRKVLCQALNSHARKIAQQLVASPPASESSTPIVSFLDSEFIFDPIRTVGDFVQSLNDLDIAQSSVRIATLARFELDAKNPTEPFIYHE